MTGGAELMEMTEAFAFLRRALDENDASAIWEATRRLSAATDAVRAHGAWRADLDTRRTLEALVPEIESARIRLNLASDDLRRRISVLADHGAQAAPLIYRR